MGTARVKQEEEADTRIIGREEETDTIIIAKEEEADTIIIAKQEETDTRIIGREEETDTIIIAEEADTIISMKEEDICREATDSVTGPWRRPNKRRQIGESRSPRELNPPSLPREIGWRGRGAQRYHSPFFITGSRNY